MAPLYRSGCSGFALFSAILIAGSTRAPRENSRSSVTLTVNANSVTSQACPEDQRGLRLLPGFCATIFADSIGAARHIVVAANGDVFVNLQATKRGPVASILAGQIGLRDTDGDGRADMKERFGNGGGTGIALYKGFLYADLGTSIVRYPLPPGQLRPSGPPETVASGLPGQPGHISRNLAITADGTMFVNVGSPSNTCQLKDRSLESPGKEDCPELMTRAGIWKFDANTLGQTPLIESRYSTGVRNAVAMTLDPAGKRLYAIPNGRDQLSQNWPSLFTPEQNAELPAETMIEIAKGDDFGWPYCYYDGKARQYRLAPEYGGNGTTVGRCAQLKAPLYSFPAHWAPLSMLFSTNSHFPVKYRDGIFVASHGSWNRAPLPQAGFNVVFLPFQADHVLGDFELFADGFAVENPPPNGAAHRPVGLAQGPDGALYISDDVGGRIWRVTWVGSGS